MLILLGFLFYKAHGMAWITFLRNLYVTMVCPSMLLASHNHLSDRQPSPVPAPTPGLLFLPPETLWEILSYLDILHVRQVCFI